MLTEEFGNHFQQPATVAAKPFLKWAGGKSQLIDQMTAYFPPELGFGGIRRYVEPFIGGGAIFFHVAQTYPIEQLYISDVNEELVLAYLTVREDVESLIDFLSELDYEYNRADSDQQATLFYRVRSQL